MSDLEEWNASYQHFITAIAAQAILNKELDGDDFVEEAHSLFDWILDNMPPHLMEPARNFAVYALEQAEKGEI